MLAEWRENKPPALFKMVLVRLSKKKLICAPLTNCIARDSLLRNAVHVLSLAHEFALAWVCLFTYI